MNRASKIVRLDVARKRGLTGKGVGIAIFDTGIGYHPDLFESKSPGLVAFHDTTTERKSYYDDNGHGTHVAGIIAGSGESTDGMLQGIAPGCHYVVIKILNKNGEGNIEHVLLGIRWLLEHWQEYNIRIVNISVGSAKGKEFGEDSPLVKGVEKLWNAGLTVLTAAGNHGPSPSSIGAPGNSRKIITVGSSDLIDGPSEADYSGRGPTKSCIKKPDIIAPGSNIMSCYPMIPARLSGHYYPLPAKRTFPKLYNGAPYFARSGTSMATPIVSGCIALLLEQEPNLTNKEIKLRLKDTALNLGYSHSRQGWGLIRLDRLL